MVSGEGAGRLSGWRRFAEGAGRSAPSWSLASRVADVDGGLTKNVALQRAQRAFAPLAGTRSSASLKRAPQLGQGTIMRGSVSQSHCTQRAYVEDRV